MSRVSGLGRLWAIILLMVPLSQAAAQSDDGFVRMRALTPEDGVSIVEEAGHANIL